MRQRGLRWRGRKNLGARQARGSEGSGWRWPLGGRIVLQPGARSLQPQRLGGGGAQGVRAQHRIGVVLRGPGRLGGLGRDARRLAGGSSLLVQGHDLSLELPLVGWRLLLVLHLHRLLRGYERPRRRVDG